MSLLTVALVDDGWIEVVLLVCEEYLLAAAMADPTHSNALARSSRLCMVDWLRVLIVSAGT